MVEDKTKKLEENNTEDQKNIEKFKSKKVVDNNLIDYEISNQVEVLLPKYDNQKVVQDFINAFELSLYKKNIKKITLNINQYTSKKDLENIILKKAKPGKIFIGPLTTNDTKGISKLCNKKILFFSFAHDRSYGKDCIYLVNFFPRDDLIAIFNNLKSNSKVALLYPENDYGYYINSIIDPIVTNSNSVIINRASYKEDLSNAREAIKELSKYELRKYELERQKKILRSKNDDISKRALRKIEKFETAGVVDFTHIILPDYSLRLLQIAPLLPFYDIDPDKVKFVGTGVWDNEVFFNEPSLQQSIFPGIALNKRRKYINDYFLYYKKEPIRTITIPYDLIGIIEYIIEKKISLEEVKQLLNNENISFEGMDGKFYFKENVISRELDILKINKGEAILVKGLQ